MSLLTRLIRKYHRKYSRWSLKQMGIYETIQEIPHETDPGDLRRIYLMIKQLKPEKVLEYGPGVSTYVILLALAENNRGSLISVNITKSHVAEINNYYNKYSFEQHEEYRDRIFSIIPKALKSRLCESTVWNAWEADFIYIDDENQDILPTLNRAKQGTKVLIDGRVEQTKQIVKFLQTQRAFQFKKTSIYENPLITLGEIKS